MEEKSNFQEWNSNIQYHDLTKVIYRGEICFAYGINNEPMSIKDFIHAKQVKEGINDLSKINSNLKSLGKNIGMSFTGVFKKLLYRA